MESGCWTEGVFISLGGPQAHDHSGRDGKVYRRVLSERIILSKSQTVNF